LIPSDTVCCPLFGYFHFGQFHTQDHLKAQADFYQLQHTISTQFQSTLRSTPSSQKDEGDVEKAYFNDSGEQAFNL
jgi:hypothetical protein